MLALHKEILLLRPHHAVKVEAVGQRTVAGAGGALLRNVVEGRVVAAIRGAVLAAGAEHVNAGNVIAAGQLRDTLGCETTVEQIAAACELSVEDITLSMSASMEVESIYKTIYQGDGSEVMLMDKLEDKADIGETASSKVALAQLMETLSQREKELIRMRYYDDYTQMQVAKEFGISQVQVSRMEKKILSGMRKRLFA